MLWNEGLFLVYNLSLPSRQKPRNGGMLKRKKIALLEKIVFVTLAVKK